VPRHPYNGYGYGHYSGYGRYGNNYGSHYPYYGSHYGYGHYHGSYGHYPYYGYRYPYYSYYYPYYSFGFYYGYPYYWGAYYGYPYWGAYWGWPYGSVGFSYGGGGGGDYDASDYQGAARLEVKPRQTEVFVDGYYAGVVDDFDGFKRLRLEPGEHEVTLYLDGYRPMTQRMLFTQGQTFKVEHQMEPLAAGEPEPPRPTPTAKPAPPVRDHNPGYGQDPNGGHDNGAYGRTSGSSSHRPAVRINDGAPHEAGEPARGSTDIEIIDPSQAQGGPSGTLSVRVQPEDAEILVDGEPWARSGGDRLVVTLAPGVHRLEIRKPGFEPYSGLVRVRPSTGTTLNVALAPEEKR